MSTQRKRPNPNRSPKPVPMARVVASPGNAKPQAASRRKRRRFPWAAMTAISATALLFAGIVWMADRTEVRSIQAGSPVQADSEVAGVSGPNLEKAAALDDGDASSAEEAVADATVDQVAPIVRSEPKGEAVEEFDAGSLDVSLLQALEPETISESGRFAGEAPDVRTLALSADGRLLASGGDDGAVRLWDVESKQPLRQLEGHTGPVHCLAFSADGGRVASGGEDQTVRVWDVASGGETRQLTGHRDTVGGVAFAPDGRSIYSAGGDGSLKKWDLATGEAVRSVEGDVGLTKLALSPNGEAVLAGGWEGSIFVWDGTSPSWTHPVASADGPSGGPVRKHAAAIAYLHVDAAGNVVSADEAGEVVAWGLSTGDDVGRSRVGGPVLGHVPTSDGWCVLSAEREGAVQVWDSETASATHKLVGHEGPVAAIARSASGELAVSAGWDGTLRLWSLPATRPLPVGE